MAGEDAGAVDVDASAASGPCPFGEHRGNFEVIGQAQLETLRGCKRVTGHLSIHGDDITDLSALADLEEVGDTFWLGAPFGGWRAGVSRNTALRNLHGLEALRTTRGGLQMFGLAAVENLEPLSGLEGAPYLRVDGMDALTDLRGLGTVRWNSLEIRGNAKLTSLDGLYVPANAWSVTLSQNPSLASLKALPPLQQLGETLELDQLPALASLDGVQNLQPGFPALRIQQCDGLIDLKGLSGFAASVALEGNARLRTLAGPTTSNNTTSISIADNPKLEDIAGIAPASGAYLGISLRGLPSLKSLAGLEQPAQSQTVELKDCDGLRDLTGLSGLQRVDLLVIDSCAGLQSLRGIDALEFVTNLRITNNAALTSLYGLEKMEYLTSLEVSGNPALPNLAGLSMHGASEVRVVSNAALQNLQGFGLAGTQTLIIESNPVLADLTGLEHLVNVPERLSIRSNPALTSLRALTSFTVVGEATIAQNQSLPQCEVDWLAKQLRVTLDSSTNGPPGMCPP